MDADRNAQALLALIEDDRARRVAECREEAGRSAAAILQAARAAARARVRNALLHERRRLRDRLSACEAALATQVRVHDQHRFRALLDEAHRALPAALASRWEGEASREAWVSHVVASARASLPRGAWTIAYGARWPEAERARLAAELARQKIAATFVHEAALGPGLEVRADGNRVDGTAAGLAADAGEVGARLLEALASPAAA